jgi:pimeloyl-ACP methyl ester carboxylesterase
MLVELAACEPPREIIVIEAPAQNAVEVTLDALLSPFNPLREQITAITGLGLDVEEPPEALRLYLPVPHLPVPHLPLPHLPSPHLPLPATDPEIQLSYLATGNPAGQKVVFIHGSPGNAQEWGPLLSRAPHDQYRVAIDRLGFGESVVAEPVLTLAGHAGALAPLLDTGDGRKAILVGYSYGGPVALRAALDMPEHVAGIVLVGSAADPDFEDIHPLQELAALELFAQILPTELANANAELVVLKPELEAMREELGRLNVPVTIIHGLNDSLVPPENILFLHVNLPRHIPVRTMLVEGGDHFLPWTHPERIEHAIRCILEPAP